MRAAAGLPPAAAPDEGACDTGGEVRHAPARAACAMRAHCFPQPQAPLRLPARCLTRAAAPTAHVRHLLRHLQPRGDGVVRLRPRLLPRLLGRCASRPRVPPCSPDAQVRLTRAVCAGYARAALGDGPAVLSLRCAAPGCGVAAPRELLSSLFSDAERERYDAFRLRSFVENNARVRWCPGAGCGRAVERAGGGGGGAPEDVACAQPPAGCGAVFCWTCGAEAHRPLACATVRAWLIKCSAESENMTWCASLHLLGLHLACLDGAVLVHHHACQDLGAHQAVPEVHASD